MITRRGVVLGAAVIPVVARSRSTSRAPVAETTLGRVRGSAEGGMHVFRGIRYGVAERFKAPAAPRPSRETVDALPFGPSAPQRGVRYTPQTEDCLFLNVWTPEAQPGDGRPVMVYFHGGAYSTGSVADPLNDGRHLAARGDVVAVTVTMSNPYIGPGSASPAACDYRTTHVGDASDTSPYTTDRPVTGISISAYIANRAALIRALPPG